MTHIDDYSFRHSCAAFIQEQLGTTSDDASAAFACSECGARFGHLDPTQQPNVGFCLACESGCAPVPVDPIQLNWVPEDKGHCDAGAGLQKSPATRYSPEEIALGKTVHERAVAEMRRRGVPRLHRRHVDIAISQLREEGVTQSSDRLRVLRKRYRDKKYNAAR
jgi:hypothetical protein